LREIAEQFHGWVKNRSEKKDQHNPQAIAGGRPNKLNKPRKVEN